MEGLYTNCTDLFPPPPPLSPPLSPPASFTALPTPILKYFETSRVPGLESYKKVCLDEIFKITYKFLAVKFSFTNKKDDWKTLDKDWNWTLDEGEELDTKNITVDGSNGMIQVVQCQEINKWLSENLAL